MPQLFDPQGVEAFRMFDFDCGKLFGDESLDGVSLYDFRPVQRSGKVQDFETITPAEFRQMQADERSQRATMMGDLLTPAKMKELEAEGLSVTDLIDPPKYV